MNIVFYHASLHRGGAERVITSLANYYAAAHNVSIITIDNGEREYTILPNVRHVKLCGLKQNKSLKKSLEYNVILIKLLRKALKELEPDVVICMGVNQLLHAYCAKCGLKYKLIGSERANPYTDPCGVKWNIIKRYLYKHVDGFVFQTSGASKFYEKKLLKGTIIKNPIANEFIESDEINIENRDNNKFYSVGRLVAEKGYDYLINAFVKFHSLYNETTLTIYGEGKEREKLEELISENQADTYIFLPGKLENVAEEMQKAKFFILSSKTEGMPNTLLEAMASGCICVSTDCDFGPGEIIIHGINGFLVEYGNEKQLIENLSNIYKSKTIQESVSSRAKEVKNTNSLNNIANQYLEYIESLF